MSGEHDERDFDLSRRTFVKSTGVAVGAGALGVGATGSGAAASGLDDRFLNWRTVEARKVWERGYRGRPDRTLALTDSGIATRHPELGPWNGVVADVDDDGNLLLADAFADGVEFPDRDGDVAITTLATLSGSGTIGPGGPQAQTRQVIVEFVPATAADERAEAGGQDLEPTQLDGRLTWTPQRQDNELFLEKRVDGEWQQVAAGTDFNPETGAGETVTVNDIDPGATYRWVIETFVNAAANYEFTGEVNNRQGIDRPTIDFDDPSTVDPFEEIPDDPGAVGPDTPKTVGWYSRSDRYTESNQPVDPNGHGSHVSGIMAGSGRASSIDLENTRVERPGTVLLPTDFIEYEVTAGAGTTVFASAFGTGIVVEIVGPDDEVVHEAPLRADSIVADEPARHGRGTATYRIRVRPVESRTVSADLPGRALEGNPGAARLERIAIGTYRQPGTTSGARTPLADGEDAMHPGLAPNQSLVGLTGLGQPTNDLGEIADDLATHFNLRAVNMSWGPGFGLPIGQFGGALDPVWDQVFAGNIDSPRTLNAIEFAAKNGVLTVAAAGNSFTPANGNGFPAIADEAISVAATGPLDGITSYSSGGLGGVDEDDNSEQYFKPDVTAPGGDIEPDAAGYIGVRTANDTVPVDVNYPVPSRKELVRSAMAPGSGYDDNPVDGDPPRDHVSVGGTSMASPYVCGMAGLLAQAMEEDAPEPIRLPEPAELAAMSEEEALAWTMRLKQVILATANETAFTAAPYHNAKAVPSTPTYQHGDRDPYEGYGRANPDAAVDAVTRNLLGTDPALGDDAIDATHAESVGLYVPEDDRVAAGHVRVPGGTLEASIEFTDYGGANSGMAAAAPHLDLFVYDAETPAAQGEPNIVASAQGRQGSASVSVSVDRGSRDDPTERTLFVVAKIVNVPGAVNGYDVQANFDLEVAFDPAADFPAVETEFTASGARSDDGTVFTGGQTDRVEVTIGDFQHADAVEVTDQVPDGWTVYEGVGDVERFDEEEGVVHFAPTVTEDEVGEGKGRTLTYFAEAPSGPQQTGQYTFGPATAHVLEADVPTEDGDGTLDGDQRAVFGGVDDNVVVGPSTET